MSKNLIRIAGVAAVASLLLLGAGGCSKISSMQEEAPAVPSSYFVTIGASLPDKPDTRSAGVLTDGTWKLQFTDTDQIFVTGWEVDGHTDLILSGTLTIVPGSLDPSDPWHASFSGELTVYEEKEVIIGYDPDTSDPYTDFEYTETTYDLSAYDNPLEACDGVSVILIPSGDMSAFKKENPISVYLNADRAIADSVEELMAHSVELWGWYDPETDRILLDTVYPILDITVSGLTPDADYKIDFYFADATSGEEIPEDMWIPIRSIEAPRTASSDGTLHFAVPMMDWGEGESSVYYFIKLEENYNKTFTVLLGNKKLDGKVYTVSRTVIADPVDPTLPAVTGDFAFYRYDEYCYFEVAESGTCTVSGEGSEVMIGFSDNSKLVLDGAHLTNTTGYAPISGNTFSLELQGDNSLYAECGYIVDGASVSVSGNGTLTVTSYYSENDILEALNLTAASGYVLTNTVPESAGDGIYTCTITVRPE